MDSLTEKLQCKLTHALLSKFSIAFDGWSPMQTGFVCVFALSPSKDSCGYGRSFWGFSLFEDELSINVSSHIEFFEFFLSVFVKNMDNVTCPIGNSCNNNKAVAYMLEKPLIACHGHGFNLAVQDVLQNYFETSDTVYELMYKFQNLVTAAKLRSPTRRPPILMNRT